MVPAVVAEGAPVSGPALAPAPLPPEPRRDEDAPAVRAPAVEAPVVKPPSLASGPIVRRARNANLYAVSFALLVLLPTLVVGLYYMLVAADQYKATALFSVRGTTPSSTDSLGLTTLLGASSAESADSYIVVDYIQSEAIIDDIRKESGLDLRKIFANPKADWVVRAAPEAPMNVFLDYWQNRISVGFNSTTGITTFEVMAFSAKDAETVARAVLQASERLVNDLSMDARQALIQAAREEVVRREERLREARRSTQVFREREQIIDPQASATSTLSLIGTLEASLADLKARRDTLLQTIDPASPSVRVLDRQIRATSRQIEEQRKRLGSGSVAGAATEAPAAAGDDRSLSKVVGDYLELALEEQFATQAYTSALSSLEMAIAEARKQERYFATFVAPNAPEVSRYPRRMLNTVLFGISASILWGLVVLFAQIIRDHAL